MLLNAFAIFNYYGSNFWPVDRFEILALSRCFLFFVSFFIFCIMKFVLDLNKAKALAWSEKYLQESFRIFDVILIPLWW